MTYLLDIILFISFKLPLLITVHMIYLSLLLG